MSKEIVAPRKTRFWADTSGTLEKLAAEIIKKEFRALQHVRFVFAWREPHRMRNGRPVYGEVKKCATRDRDLFQKDVIVILAKGIWKEFNPKQRLKLMWHELYHVDVPLQDTLEPEVDDRGRIKIVIRKHDCNLERFYDELERFGPDAEERTVIKRLSKIYKTWKTENGIGAKG